jgi:hypothetical protein
MLEGKMFNSQDRKIHFGLLIMRLGLTAVLLLHALPKLFAGAHSWESAGTSLGFIRALLALYLAIFSGRRAYFYLFFSGYISLIIFKSATTPLCSGPWGWPPFSLA